MSVSPSNYRRYKKNGRDLQLSRNHKPAKYLQGSIDARDADYQLDETSFFLRRLWPGICKRRFSVTIQKNFGFRFDAVGALLEVAVLRIRVGAPHDRTLDLSCSWEGNDSRKDTGGLRRV